MAREGLYVFHDQSVLYNACITEPLGQLTTVAIGNVVNPNMHWASRSMDGIDNNHTWEKQFTEHYRSIYTPVIPTTTQHTRRV